MTPRRQKITQCVKLHRAVGWWRWRWRGGSADLTRCDHTNHRLEPTGSWKATARTSRRRSASFALLERVVRLLERLRVLPVFRRVPLRRPCRRVQAHTARGHAARARSRPPQTLPRALLFLHTRRNCARAAAGRSRRRLVGTSARGSVRGGRPPSAGHALSAPPLHPWQPPCAPPPPQDRAAQLLVFAPSARRLY